jgi:hypothetical protein
MPLYRSLRRNRGSLREKHPLLPDIITSMPQEVSAQVPPYDEIELKSNPTTLDLDNTHPLHNAPVDYPHPVLFPVNAAKWQLEEMQSFSKAHGLHMFR